MSKSPLTAELRRFVEERIASVEQLEILMFLQGKPTRFWDGPAVAHALRMDPPRAAASIEALARLGLLDVRIASEVKYRFSPTSEAMAQGVKQLAEAYSVSRVELLALAASPRRRSSGDASTAFRGRDDSGDG